MSEIQGNYSTDRKPTVPLFKQLVRQFSRLAEVELELVKAESEQKLQKVKQDTNIIVLSYMFILVGLICFIAAVTFVVSPYVQPWITLFAFSLISLCIAFYCLKYKLG